MGEGLTLGLRQQLDSVGHELWDEAGALGLSGGEREPWRIGQGAQTFVGAGPLGDLLETESGFGTQSLALRTIVPGLSRPLVAT